MAVSIGYGIAVFILRTTKSQIVFWKVAVEYFCTREHWMRWLAGYARLLTGMQSFEVVRQDGPP